MSSAPSFSRTADPPFLAVLALVFNALVWGTSWYAFRRLEGAGLHPLFATAMVFGASAVAVMVLRPASILQVLRTPALWILVIAAGVTNAAFNWGVVIGDVVRVVLLFYLMPLWAVLLAWLLLGERLGTAAGARVALGVAGAAIVLWPPGGGLPIPQSLADWLGVLGGFSFALNNVMLRREAAQPEEGRALAMFFGGSVVAIALAITVASRGAAAWPPAPETAWVLIALGLAATFLCSNFALQYGAARLPANLTAVVMLTEVLFASVSSLLLGGGVPSPQLLLGGALILAGAVLAAFGRDAAA